LHPKNKNIKIPSKHETLLQTLKGIKSDGGNKEASYKN
jgi:hypothetical protein